MKSPMKDKSMNGRVVTQMIPSQKRLKDRACLLSNQGTMSSRRMMGGFEA